MCLVTPLTPESVNWTAVLQVVWVDLLTRREFEQGFGSHTPMFTGQTKCVRYYMNFPRALALHKEVRKCGGSVRSGRGRVRGASVCATT